LTWSHEAYHVLNHVRGFLLLDLAEGGGERWEWREQHR
jgi:hypothetical protein